LHKRLISIGLSLILLATACNYPGLVRSPRQISAGDLRATLIAQSLLLTQTAAAGFPAQPGAPATAVPAISTPDPGQIATPAGEPLLPAAPATPTPGALPIAYTYTAQAGDTLSAVALRFGIVPAEIVSTQALDPAGFIPEGTLLGIPNTLENVESAAWLLPDAEVVNSPSAVDFDLEAFVQQAGGYLSSYIENLDGSTYTGAEIVRRVSNEASINPRLLLSILEFQSGWVLGEPVGQTARIYPIGFGVPGRTGLYEELLMTGSHLGIGYYGWRTGSLLEFRYADKTTARLSPEINPGTAALQVLFARLSNRADWHEALYGAQSLVVLHNAMFGDAWLRAAAMGPLIPHGLQLNGLELPFVPGERWGFTGGPHLSWLSGSARGAIDFSPVTGQAACAVSRAWATAVAPGIVVRAAHNTVVLDLDGDGLEQTGWVIFYYHLAGHEMIAQGSRVEQDAQLGHPSCEGGASTGTHVHLARKYNGEWIAVDGPVPLILSGWRVIAGERSYQGELFKDGRVVSANPGGPSSSIIVR